MLFLLTSQKMYYYFIYVTNLCIDRFFSKMAASKKRTVSKDDLRRLMKETKVNAGNLTRKVDHPLAK